jgi:hypothetical protein
MATTAGVAPLRVALAAVGRAFWLAVTATVGVSPVAVSDAAEGVATMGLPPPPASLMKMCEPILMCADVKVAVMPLTVVTPVSAR